MLSPRHGNGQGHSHICLMGPMFPLRFRLHNVMWVTHTLQCPTCTQSVPWRPHGTIQLCATLHEGQGAQYHALPRDRPIPDRFGPLSLALAPCWDTVPLKSPGGNSHPLVPCHQVLVSSWLISLCPPRHSEGQGAQLCSGQCRLALACAKRGAQGPSVARPPQFSAAVLSTAWH